MLIWNCTKVLLVVDLMTMVMMMLLLFYQVSKKISSYQVILALHTNNWFLTVCLIMKGFITVIVMLPIKLSLVVFGSLLLL